MEGMETLIKMYASEMKDCENLQSNLLREKKKEKKGG